MSFLKRVFLCFILILFVSVTVAFLLATESKPLVNLKWTLTKRDIERAKDIIYGQTEQQNTTTRTLALNNKDLNVAANYLLNRYLESATRISLFKNGLNFATSINLPDALPNPYLNISYTLTNISGYPEIKNLSIGRIKIPQSYAGWLIEKIIQNTPLNDYYILAGKHVRSIEFNANQVLLTYDLTSEAITQAQHLFSGFSQPETIAFYHKKLVQVIKAHDKKKRLSLADLLKPLFISATQRSKQVSAIEENRAIILVTSTYVNQQNLQPILLGLVYNKDLPKHSVFLYQRIDLAKHFMGSAALTASGNAYLAYMLGLQKELQDAEKGSGFSFIDLAADRAGMKFAEYATRSEETARDIQRSMAAIKNYKAFMPDFRDLPEKMNAKQFKERYESIYSESYQQLLQQIDQRIASCIIYKDS